jgi:hypothetical protein
MKFLHIGIHFKGALKTKELESVFGSGSSDWIRYAPNCWIVYTDNSPQWWTEHLRPHLTKPDAFVILEVKIETYWGLHQEWVWDWMTGKNRQR